MKVSRRVRFSPSTRTSVNVSDLVGISSCLRSLSGAAPSTRHFLTTSRFCTEMLGNITVPDVPMPPPRSDVFSSILTRLFARANSCASLSTLAAANVGSLTLTFASDALTSRGLPSLSPQDANPPPLTRFSKVFSPFQGSVGLNGDAAKSGPSAGFFDVFSNTDAPFLTLPKESDQMPPPPDSDELDVSPLAPFLETSVGLVNSRE